MTQTKKLKPSEHATRVLAATSQGVRGAAVPGVGAGLGLLALAPFARKFTRDTKHVPGGFTTKTPQALVELTDKLLRAGGRNPDKGRPIQLQITKPGAAEVVQDYFPQKGRTKSRDILRLGLGATPESIAHEVGHITPKNRFSKFLSKLSPLARSRAGQALPSLLAATALSGKPGEDTPTIAKAAPYIGGAQLASIVGEEVRANRRSTKLLKSIGYKPLLKQRLGRHALTMTYLAYAATLIGAPLGVLKGVKAFDKAREKKRDMPPQGLLGRSPQAFADAPSTTELKKKWKSTFESR